MVKVVCFVETCAENLETRALSVKNTWAPRCDKTLFISDQDNSTFPAIYLPGVVKGYGGIWSKTVQSFRHLYKNYLNEYHWFMKTDDDTYVVVENLKYFLGKDSLSMVNSRSVMRIIHLIRSLTSKHAQ